MKNKCFYTIKLLILFTISFFTACKCPECPNNDCPQTSQCDLSNNVEGRIEKEAENDLTLKFYPKDNRYQQIHVDLKNDFLLLATRDTLITDESKMRLHAKLAEMKYCENFSLIEAKYLRLCYDEENGTPTHHLKFVLKQIKDNNKERVTKMEIDSTFNFNKGDNLDIHILYEGNSEYFKKLNSLVYERMPEDSCITPKPVDDVRICRTIIVSGN